MAKEIEAITLSASSVRFKNGTVIGIGPFVGTATQWTADRGALRLASVPAERDTHPDFEKAMRELEIYEQETIHLDVTKLSRLRAGRPGVRDTIVIRPARGDRRRTAVKVVLYQDESGGLSWHFPDGFFEQAKGRVGGAKPSRGLRAIEEPVFTIPTRTVAAKSVVQGERPPSHLRGPITKWGRKIFKVLVIPVASALLGKPLELIVEAIERKYRQDLIRALTPDDYRRKVDTPLEARSLSGKRALLVVHGIFSSTDGMLSQLPREAMSDIYRQYEGRVIAYDHLTVSKGPKENAQWFLEQMMHAAPAGSFEFDILCHSRGGIVSRTLVERGSDLVPGANCCFRKVFFVATPNRGSALADPDHIVDMLDVFTNLLTNFPDGPVTYSIEVILAIIKLLAYTAEKRLPGIVAMGTQDYITHVLNRASVPSPALYAAAAADYEPDPTRDNAFFTGRFADYIIDRVFSEKGRPVLNDLVVPQEGVWRENGHPSFPIRDPLLYSSDAHVWHTGFFAQKPTLDRIRDHFEVEAAITLGTRIRESSGLRGFPPSPSRRKRAMKHGLSYTGRTGAHSAHLPSRLGMATVLGSPGGLRRKRAARRKTVLMGRAPARDAGRRLEPARRVAAAPSEALRRNPAIDFHEQVKEGESLPLVVKLEDVGGAKLGSALAIELAGGEDAVDLTVTLSAPGFDVVDDREAKMTVKRERDPQSERVTFTLTARHPGASPVQREIRADFWLRNSSIGAVTYRTIVTPRGYTGPVTGDGSSTREEVTITARRREDCDLIVLVSGADESGRPPWRIRLRSAIPDNAYDGKDVGQLDVPGKDLAAFLDKVFRPQADKYPNPEVMSSAKFILARNAWEEEFADLLDDLGKRLWTFLPHGFRNEYFRLHQAGWLPRSILVDSDEMIFPWELVVPHVTNNGKLVTLPSLGVAHVLGRWKPGLAMKPVPQQLRVRKFSVLNPNYVPPLAWSLKEVKRLRKLFPNISVVSPATLKGVRTQILARPDVNMLHFTGHGQYDPGNADLNSLILEGNDKLDAFRLAGTKLAAEAHPIVYLNACSVGTTGLVVGRMGGFAANLIENGCSGVIAPYWPIDDERATEFSIGLYAKLSMGRAVGEALQELRTEKPRDPTVRAYAYFGDPWARTSFALKGSA